MRKTASHPALERLRLILRRYMDELADDLANGTAEDYSRYREKVGRIHGLGMAEAELLLIDEAMSAPDDDEADQ